MRHIVATESTGLNVRSGPGAEFPIVGSLSRGSEIDVVETRNGWCRLANGRWAASQFLRQDSQRPLPGIVPVIPRRSLPAFASLWQHYPVLGKEETKQMIGGQVDDPRIDDTCTVRLSRAFNYSGHPIPSNGRGLHTATGGDGLAYAFRVRELHAYLEQRYGSPWPRWSEAEGGSDGADRLNPRGPFLRERGVILFRVAFWGASGHFDIWDGIACRFKDYFDRAQEVLLWPTDW